MVMEQDIFLKISKIYKVDQEEAKFFLDLYSAFLEVNNDFLFNYNVLTRNHITNLEDFKKWRVNYATINGHVKALSLCGCNLKKIPESIKSLNELEYLNLSRNHLKSIPDSIYDFASKNMTSKYIEEGVIPKEAPVLGLLEILQGRKLEKGEEKEDCMWELGACHYAINNNGNIKGIYVNGELGDKIHWLEFFPEQICELESLENLILSTLDIGFIPESISNLTSLKRLVMFFNRIRKIPESMKNLSSLEELDLRDNLIQEIPEWTRQIKDLKI